MAACDTCLCKYCKTDGCFKKKICGDDCNKKWAVTGCREAA